MDLLSTPRAPHHTPAPSAHRYVALRLSHEYAGSQLTIYNRQFEAKKVIAKGTTLIHSTKSRSSITGLMYKTPPWESTLGRVYFSTLPLNLECQDLSLTIRTPLLTPALLSPQASPSPRPSPPPTSSTRRSSSTTPSPTA